MKTISLKRDDAIQQWQDAANSLKELKKENETRREFNIRTAFSISAVGVGAGIIVPSPITAISSSIMIGGGLTGILKLHFSHQKEECILQDSINYCKEQELILLENTRAKKGKVLPSVSSIRDLTIQRHKEADKYYPAQLMKRVFQSKGTKTIYVLAMSAIAASAMAASLIFNNEADTQSTSGRKEELEGTNNSTIIELEAQENQPPLPAP